MPIPAPRRERPAPGHLRGALLIALAALLWSSGGLFIKVAPMSGLAVVCARSAITAVFYLVFLRPRLSQARWVTGIVYAGMMLTFVSATKATTAANAIFLQYTGPAYVLLLAPWLLREKLQRRDVISVALSLGGMGLFFVGKVGFLLFVFLWIRATLPRYRYDQLMHVGWKFLIPVTLVNLFIAAAIKFVWM